MRIGLGPLRNFNEIRKTQPEKGSHRILIVGLRRPLRDNILAYVWITNQDYPPSFFFFGDDSNYVLKKTEILWSSTTKMLSRSWILFNMNSRAENLILLHISIIKGRRNSGGTHTHAEERCLCACQESVWRSWGILQSDLSRQHIEMVSITFRPLYPNRRCHE
jgi:hypothetical protein